MCFKINGLNNFKLTTLRFFCLSEPDFSNSSSTFASIFSECKSESDSESDYNSVFINLDICVFFILYLHSCK